MESVMSEVFLHLQRSEASVAATASAIFAAYIGRDIVDEHNADHYIDKSVALAVKLVQRVEKVVKSDEEWVKPGASSGAIL
jgi:hypothetical protein